MRTIEPFDLYSTQLSNQIKDLPSQSIVITCLVDIRPGYAYEYQVPTMGGVDSIA